MKRIGIGLLLLALFALVYLCWGDISQEKNVSLRAWRVQLTEKLNGPGYWVCEWNEEQVDGTRKWIVFNNNPALKPSDIRWCDGPDHRAFYDRYANGQGTH